MPAILQYNHCLEAGFLLHVIHRWFYCEKYCIFKTSCSYLKHRWQICDSVSVKQLRNSYKIFMKRFGSKKVKELFMKFMPMQTLSPHFEHLILFLG